MNDFQLQVVRLRPRLDEAVARVLESGWFILGKEVEAFEHEFAAFVGAGEAVAVANGMEALQLALHGWGIGPGDEVVTTPLSAFATTLAILNVGATPVFVDIDPDTGNMDASLVARTLTRRTKALLPVHLYGQSADLQPLLDLAGAHDLVLIGDAAQAHGTRYRGKDVGAYGDAVAYSFYPTKNLGALGDGGAVVCTDPERARRLRCTRNYGQAQRYQHTEQGLNSRLDEIQAAILRVKLPLLGQQNQRRRQIATYYRQKLQGLPIALPVEREYGEHVYHLFVVRTPLRDALAAFLRDRGILTLVHYPIVIPLQPAMAKFDYRPGACPVAERWAAECLSLPIYPELTHDQVEEVCAAIRGFFEAGT